MKILGISKTFLYITRWSAIIYPDIPNGTDDHLLRLFWLDDIFFSHILAIDYIISTPFAFLEVGIALHPLLHNS